MTDQPTPHPTPEQAHALAVTEAHEHAQQAVIDAYAAASHANAALTDRLALIALIGPPTTQEHADALAAASKSADAATRAAARIHDAAHDTADAVANLHRLDPTATRQARRDFIVALAKQAADSAARRAMSTHGHATTVARLRALYEPTPDTQEGDPQ